MGNITRRLPWRRGSQEEIDLWRVYQLMYYKEHSEGKEVQVKPIQGNVPLSVQKRTVDDDIMNQIKGLFSQGKGSTEPPTFTLNIINRTTANREGLQPVPGVLLRGHASPGSVVCFFPGLAYTKFHVPLMDNYPLISSNNPYLMATTNGCIIDAKSYNNYQSQSLQITDESNTTDNFSHQQSGVNNQYAVGHLVRHPSSTDVLPNVMPYTFTLSSDHPLAMFIPNRYYNMNPLIPDKTVLTIVFVAMRHIRNEEILLNYRLHPDSTLPSWYSSLDNNEDKRRWKEVKHIK